MAFSDKQRLIREAVSRRKYLAAAGTLSTGLLAGCSGSSDEGATTTQDSGGDSNGDGGGDTTETPTTSKTGGTLTTAISSSIKNLDPAYTQLVVAIMVERQIIETLFHVNQNLKVEPLLAKEATPSDDAQTWTVTLKEGVQFHKPYQREMTAEDVKYNIDRIRDPDTGAAGASILNPVEAVSVVDDYNVEFSLKEPVAGFRSILAVHTTAIMSPDALKEKGDAKNHPVGTGPFKFEEWQTGDHITMSKNESYWNDELPYVDEVTFRPISEPAVQATEVQQGNVEILSNTAPSYINQLKGKDDLTVKVKPSGGYTCVHINSASKPTKNRGAGTATSNVKVRRAINHAIDRKSMAKVVSSGLGSTAQEFYPDGSPWHIGYDRYSIQANPEKAKQLLNEAGVETPVPVTIISASTINTLKQMGVTVQDNLEQAGFDPSLKEYETGTWVDRFFAHNYDLCVNFFPFYPDPSQLRQFYHKDGVYVQPYQDGNNSSEKVMDLWSQVNQVTNPTERQELFAELQRTFFDDSVNAIMYHRPVINTWRNSVNGYEVHPYKQEINVEYAWLQDG